jgi:amino acid transporter
VRALGVRTMTFNIVNLVVGASIFVLPATVAGVLGPAPILAYVVSAVAMGFVALCFAQAGRRVRSVRLYGLQHVPAAVTKWSDGRRELG